MIRIFLDKKQGSVEQDECRYNSDLNVCIVNVWLSNSNQIITWLIMQQMEIENKVLERFLISNKKFEPMHFLSN